MKRWTTAAVVLLGGLGAAPAASAAITTANVTSPADGAILFQNHDTSPSQTFTVHGTTNSTNTATDKVDIECYNGPSQTVGSYQGPGNSGIAVAGDKSFTVQVPQTNFADRSCLLLAVPHATIPHPPTGYTGPRVGFSSVLTNKVGTGPNAGATYDYAFVSSTLTAQSGLASIGDCGPFTLLYDGTTMAASDYLFNCAGNLYGATADLNPGEDLTRSNIVVDNQNAYGSRTAQHITTASSNNPGFPGLTVTLDSFNSTTGEAQTTESENLVRCSPSNVHDPTPAQCSSFAPTGVAFKRVTHVAPGGRTQTVHDYYTSTDGVAHTLDLWYETDLQNSFSGWGLPGQSFFTQHVTGDTAGPPPTAPGTVYGLYDQTKAPSLTNPVGAMTFATPYNSIRFDNTLFSGQGSALFDYQRTVPAGGTVAIAWSYATEDNLAKAQADAAAAEAAFQPPFAQTGSASQVHSSQATVAGSVKPGGAGVSYAFQYGPSVMYGSQTKAGSLPAGTSTSPASAVAGGLKPQTTYHYRLVATSANGTSYGADRTFTTLARLKRLVLKVTPHHAVQAPFTYQVKGKLVLPKGVKRKAGCKGSVKVTFKRGKKVVAKRKFKVRHSCKYGGNVTIPSNKLSGSGKLNVVAKFGGNSVVDAASRSVKVLFG